MEIHHADARRVLRAFPPSKRFDFIFGDTFNDFSVPYHVATVEFNELLARHLKPNGLYLLNLIDSVHFDFLRSEVRTLQRTFPYVAVISPSAEWPPDPRDRVTFVLVAAKRQPAQPPRGVVPASDVDAFLRGGTSVLLTDDHVPVDQLLAPTFSHALREG
jgi:spermidine synthase